MSYTRSYSNHRYSEFSPRDPDIPRTDVYRPHEELARQRDRDRDRERDWDWDSSWNHERSHNRDWNRDWEPERGFERGSERDRERERERDRGRDANSDKMVSRRDSRPSMADADRLNRREQDKLRLDTAKIPTGPRVSRDSPSSARSAPFTAKTVPTEPCESTCDLYPWDILFR